jgi:radical SAM protein with 4Fe4S-binding SPASM domain
LTTLREFKEKSICCNGYPVWLTIDPTNICNLKCPFCPTGFGNIKRPKGMMKIENFGKIIDILGPYLLHIDMQNWGEPLLHNDIYKMISYAKEFDIHIALSTSFQNFNERNAEAMISSKLDRLILSIDGASQETYGKYRRGGSFFKAVENIKVLVRKKKELRSHLPFVIWQFLVFRHNEHEIEIVKKMGEELGVNDVGINSAFIAVDSEEYKDWVPLNKKYSRYDLTNESNTASCSDSFLKTSDEAVCNWLWQGITINWDGSVSPCCGVYLEEEDFGNILDQQNFMELWNNIRYRTARAFIQRRERFYEDINNTCVNCSKIGQINFDLDPDFWLRG